MARILLLETSTATLSAALADNGKVVQERICTEPRQQASLAAPMVKEVLDAAGITVADCDAVCVSKGPGSYTGLRVGVSTAKGLCFGAGIPLLSAGTLDILAAQAREIPCPTGQLRYVVPMIDARRMEVYTAVYTPDGQRLTEVSPLVVDASSFADRLQEGPVLFIGDGALKCKEVISSPNAFFRKAAPLASAMAGLAQRAFDKKRFEDIAYFEPFYLKDFIATVPKKKLF